KIDVNHMRAEQAVSPDRNIAPEAAIDGRRATCKPGTLRVIKNPFVRVEVLMARADIRDRAAWVSHWHNSIREPAIVIQVITPVRCAVIWRHRMPCLPGGNRID